MQKVPLDPIVVHYTGLFDFDALYAAIIDWIKNEGYVWHEEDYKHKVPSPAGAEQEWYWWGEKEVTDYIRYKINIWVHGWEITEVEVVKEGKKKILTNGRIQMSIKGEVTIDWQKKFEGSRLKQWLGGVYYKMKRREIEGIYFDNLNYRIWNLHAVIKKFFDMQTKWHEYKRYLGED